MATQVPVAEWHLRFPDPTIGDAILDRLVHNAYRLALKGESRRKISSPLPMPTSWCMMIMLASLRSDKWMAWPEHVDDFIEIRGGSRIEAVI